MRIYGYMEILQFPSTFRHFFFKYLNFRRIFVKYLNFRRMFVEFPVHISEISSNICCRPNAVNLGPWANELEDKWILYT